MRLDEIELEKTATEVFNDNIKESQLLSSEKLLTEEQQVLLEFSKAGVFKFFGMYLPAGALAAFTIASILTGNPAIFAVGLATFPLAVFKGLVNGLIVSLFVRGERRDIYMKMNDKVKKVTRILADAKSKAENIEDEVERDRIIRSAVTKVRADLGDIEDLQNRLERLLKEEKGDAGVFRTPFRQWLGKRLASGKDTDVEKALTDIKKELEKMGG